MRLTRAIAPRILLQPKVLSHIQHLLRLHDFPENFQWQKH